MSESKDSNVVSLADFRRPAKRIQFEMPSETPDRGKASGSRIDIAAFEREQMRVLGVSTYSDDFIKALLSSAAAFKKTNPLFHESLKNDKYFQAIVTEANKRGIEY